MVGWPVRPFLGVLNARNRRRRLLKHGLETGCGWQPKHNPLQGARFGLGFGRGKHVTGVGQRRHAGAQALGLGVGGETEHQFLQLVAFDGGHCSGHALAQFPD